MLLRLVLWFCLCSLSFPFPTSLCGSVFLIVVASSGFVCEVVLYSFLITITKLQLPMLTFVRTFFQAAHVGVGISGVEGLQAACASDYSIAQVGRRVSGPRAWNSIPPTT